MGGLPAPPPTPLDTTSVRADYLAYVAAFVDACVPEPDSEHLRRWGRQILPARRSGGRGPAPRDLRRRVRRAGPLGRHSPDPRGARRARRRRTLGVGQAVAAAIADAELVVIAGAGHVPTVTRPREVVDAITSWAGRVLPQP